MGSHSSDLPGDDNGDLDTLRVLIVEDSLRMRSFLKFAFDTLGFDCVEASDGISALQFASGEEIDLIVTDLKMPRMDGNELIELIERGAFGLPPPPVIVCSSAIETVKYRESDFITLVAKPVAFPDIVKTVESLFERDALPTRKAS